MDPPLAHHHHLLISYLRTCASSLDSARLVILPMLLTQKVLTASARQGTRLRPVGRMTGVLNNDYLPSQSIVSP